MFCGYEILEKAERIHPFILYFLSLEMRMSFTWSSLFMFKADTKQNNSYHILMLSNTKQQGKMSEEPYWSSDVDSLYAMQVMQYIIM